MIAVYYYAYNKSFYPYQLTLNFDFIENLTPEVVFEKFIIYPGRKSFFTLTVKDKERGHYCRYSMKYILGDPSEKPIADYPYLIPISKFRTFELSSKNITSNTFIKNSFKIKKGDTIYCMRKGDVTATPNMYNQTDRVSKQKSLEIKHGDGSVMIYENINPDSVFVKAGQTVYPNEPLGIINETAQLEVNLYSFEGDGKLKRLDINYYINENIVESFNEKFQYMDIRHPIEIIIKEMTNKEIKKYKKNKLF
jgi:hypothetical protein